MTSEHSSHRQRLRRGRWAAIGLIGFIVTWQGVNVLSRGEQRQGTSPGEKAELGEYVGWYELESERVVLITWAAGGGLRIYDFEGHESHDLYLHEESSFIWKGRDSSPNRTVSFERDAKGAVDQLRWRADDGREEFARRLPDHGYAQAEVRFANKDVELFGTLLIPRSAPPHPGVVFLHGSGTSNRDNLWYFAIVDRFARNGIAVLLPDKRAPASRAESGRLPVFMTLQATHSLPSKSSGNTSQSTPTGSGSSGLAKVDG